MPPGDHDRQAFPRILLDDGEDLQRPAVMRAVRYAVIRPDVVPILRPAADARAIREPQPAPFRLFLRHFEAFSPPQSLDAFVIHRPAFPAQQPGDAPIPRPTFVPRAMNKLSRLSAPLGSPIEGQIRAQARWSRPIVRHPDSYPRSGGCQADVRRAVFDAKSSGQRRAWPPLRLEPEPQVSRRRSVRPSTRGQHRTPCDS